MRKTYNRIIVFLFLTLSFPLIGKTQEMDRFQLIERRLNEVALNVYGLDQKIDFSVSGVSLQEFLRAIAEANNLNINIDPAIDIKLFNSFKQEKVSNIILFLVKEHDLDIRFTGNIMSFSKYIPPLSEPEKPKSKELSIHYNSLKNQLNLDLKSDTLSQVVRKIVQITKKNIILSPGLENMLVSVYIENLQFESAIEKFVFANRLLVSKTQDGVYVIERLPDNEDPLESLNTQYIGKQNSSNADKKNKRKKISQQQAGFYFNISEDTPGEKRIELDAVNVPILDIIKVVATELNLSYFIYSDLKGNATINVSNVSFQNFLHYLFNGTDYTFKYEYGLYLIGDRKSEGIRATKVMQLFNRPLDNVVESIPADIKKGVEIKEFKELNSVLLTGSYPQIVEIQNFITSIDKIVPMVTIEVILVDVRKGKSIKTGIKAGVSDSVRTGGTILPGIDFNFGSRSINDFLSKLGSNNTVNLGRVSPNFYFGLSALEDNSNVEVRSMPKLTTLNGHEANLTIGSTRYYSITTQNVLGSLSPQTVITQQYNPVQANLSIGISPVISGDDQVTLKIDVNISDFIGEAVNNAPPPSATSQFKSIIRVRNEEMIVLGGLERNEKSDGGTGIPVLSRIPVLKWIFSSRTKSTNKVVSIVFIKPTILY